MTQEPVIPGFHVLSDPIRLQIISLVKDEELSLSDIANMLSTPQSQLTFHLKSLTKARLINARRKGQWMYYSLNRNQLDYLQI